MLLVSDIGNTNIKIGLFENNNLIKKFCIESNIKNTVNDYMNLLSENLSDLKISDCIIGSVSDEVLPLLEKSVKNLFKINPVIVNKDSFKGLKICTENPEKTGIDRLANVYALFQKYDKPVIVVDAGTAITIDILKENMFIGGIIMPGIKAQLKSLNFNTSKLPDLNISKSDFVIGNSTEKSILSGVLRGTACAIDGLLKQCSDELGKNLIIAGCGGQCKLISEYMTVKFDFIDENITLYGLKKTFKNYD